jgi:hypothetical protein
MLCNQKDLFERLQTGQKDPNMVKKEFLNDVRYTDLSQFN